jgi:diguanylate cyclase (GGDEF)-like protein
VPSPPARTGPARQGANRAHPKRPPARSNPTATTVAPVQPVRLSPIQRIERVIPEAVWIALAASLALAAVGGIAALGAGRKARRHARQVVEVSAAALTDPLTGVLNRRGFTEATERELDRARRYGRPFVLAYVDVRGLKAVNDTQGHHAGDRLLCEAASLLTDSARAHDVVGRIGGDELALLLTEQSTEGAAAATRRIRAVVPARRAALGLQTPWDLTVGTATFPEDGQTFDQLLQAADRRLYEQRGIALS